MCWVADSHFPALALLVNDAYSVACELTARHTAAGSTLGGPIFVFAAHCTSKCASSKLSLPVIVHFVASDGLALLFGVLLNRGFGDLAGSIFKFFWGL